MTEQEKQALLQFMGQAYGHTHKQDQMIVGKSQQLSPQSHILKQQFEEVLKTPTQQPQQQNAQAPVPMQEPVAPPAEPQGYIPPTPVTVEQAQQELAATVANTTGHVNTNQVEFDFSEPSKIDKLITLVEKQHLLLKEINIKLGNGKTTKGSRQK